MNIVLQSTLAEWKLGSKVLWKEVGDKSSWMIYSFILIIATFILESSVAIPKDGGIKVVIGGPVSWFGLAGALGLVIYTVKQGTHVRMVMRERIGHDEIVFISFTDNGIEYGTRNEVASYYSWKFVSRVDVTPQSFSFRLPGIQLSVGTKNFKDEEAKELRKFLSEQRERLRPESFFGWRKKAPGKESYGIMK